jgi:eukaryotic-like serine/threonine-protein kinase
MPLPPGSQLGPYKILAPLGAGGMGEVYRAHDSRLGRDVALKILPADVANDATRRQRFELEARAVAALNHPNIVAVYDVGEGYIVTELVEGEPLRGKLALRKTIDVAAQIASALAAAHDAGIVHRDLKPANILLTREGRPKVLDFGLAKTQAVQAAAADATVTVRTEPGIVMGTPGYMSPEQVRGVAVDHRSDIFSFGVILHELLTGKRAFSGETSVDTMQAILRQEPAELPETVPAGLRQIVSHCLEKDAAARFQSARDLGFALQSISLSGGHASLPAARSRRPIFVIAVAAIALIALGVGAAKLLWRDAAVPQWSGVLLGGPEMALNPRLSPDGHLLGLQAIENGQSQVAVMKPVSGNWSILTHRRDRGPINQISWSPDGAVIYYDRVTDVPGGVYSVPILGGEEHLVLENATTPEALPDGSLLLVRVNSRRERQLYRFWPDTGRLKELPLESTAIGLFQATCSRVAANAKEAITLARPLGGGAKGVGLYAIDLASDAIRRLPSLGNEAADLLAWTVTRDGESVIAALPAGSTTRVVSIPVRGTSAARTLFTATNTVWYLDAAADRSIFVSLVDRPQELGRASPEGGATERAAASLLGAFPDQVLLLPDDRAVAPVGAAGHLRLMASRQGKDPLPLINTVEETSAPMAVAGPREIAFMIGPQPHQTIGLAETANGRITRRIAPEKGVITGLTASADGATLYFCAAGSVWAVPAAGGEPRMISTGDYVIMARSDRALIVTRTESSRIKLFLVPLDGAPEREIPVDPSIPLFGDHAGYFSSGSLDSAGRLLVSLVVDSWFNPIGILDTHTGRITRVPGDNLGDHHSAVWTPDGRMLFTKMGLRATIWKFQPDAR